MPAPDVLSAIAEDRRRSLGSLPPPPARVTASTVRFEAIFAGPRPAVIAEIKPASPSAGNLLKGRSPLPLAAAFLRGGASALSVLTEEKHFGGSYDLLSEVSRGTLAVCLAKDFVVDAVQILHARAAGAASVLLIAELCSRKELSGFIECSRGLAMEPLVEVHDEQALDRALAAGATIVGVNARNLRTLAMEPVAQDRLAHLFPPGIIPVALSGIRTPERARELAGLGYRGLLVGTAAMTSSGPASFIRSLVQGLGEPS